MIAGGDMLSDDWESMTIDELFELHKLIQDVLRERLKARKAEIGAQTKDTRSAVERGPAAEISRFPIRLLTRAAH